MDSSSGWGALVPGMALVGVGIGLFYSSVTGFRPVALLALAGLAVTVLAVGGRLAGGRVAEATP